jgi:hypothetical protein
LILGLSASDPQGAAMIISGSVNGTGFACAAGGASCSIDITDEGAGPITFRVDSATGLYSEGSTTYYLDVTTPDIDGSFLGVTGANGWYVSTVDLTASAWDTLSGLASFDMSLNGGSFISYADTTFTDGMHTVELSATDTAGNSTETTITFNIDTTTPSLNVSINGTMGKNGWYRTNVQVSASAGDVGAGVAQIQVSRDGGAYTSYTSPVSFPDGDHTYQFKVTDHAGNVTVSPVQEIHVDATGPDIQLMEETELGETLYYEVQDNGSELTLLQFVIEDEDERFDQLIWSEDISGDYHDGGILWDGKFADGTQASTGTYTLTIKAKDAAGNESRKLGVITVDLFSFLIDIPPFVPPFFALSGAPVETRREEGETNAQGADEGTTTPGTTFGGNTVSRISNTYTKTTFLAPSTTNPLTATDSQNIVWGAVAAAAVAATLAEWQRKREEEEAARRPEKQGQSDYLRKAVAKRIQRDAEIQAQNRETAAMQTYHASERASVRPPVPMPSGLSPEAQQAFQHSSQAASWVAANAPQLQNQYAQKKQQESTTGAALKVLAAPTIAQNEKGCEWWDIGCWMEKVLMPPTPTPTLPGPIFMIIHAPTQTPTETRVPTSTVTSTPYSFTPSLFDYGIRINGFNENQRMVVLNAANLISNKLLPYIPGNGGYPTWTFGRAMGPVTIYIDPNAHIDDYGGNCLTTGNSVLPDNIRNPIQPLTYKTVYQEIVHVEVRHANGVDLYSITIDGNTMPLTSYGGDQYKYEMDGKPVYIKITKVGDDYVSDTSVSVDTPQTIVCKRAPTEPTIIHEFGHVLWNTQNSRGVSMIDLINPIAIGNGNSIDFEDGYWIRQPVGFINGIDSWEHKPRNNDWTSGVAKSEHSADMFLNFIYDGTGNENYGFTDDIDGDTRRLEMDQILKVIFGQ